MTTQTNPTVPEVSSDWLPPLEAAKHIKCCKNLLDRDRSSRKLGIPYYKLGRHVRYRRSDLDAWLEGRRVG